MSSKLKKSSLGSRIGTPVPRDKWFWRLDTSEDQNNIFSNFEAPKVGQNVDQVPSLPLEGGSGVVEAAQEVSLKYQLPREELNALISVTNDNDLDHMMHEYDRLYWPNSKSVRMRLFLFDQPNAAKPPPSNIDLLFGLDNHVASLPPHVRSFAAFNFHHPLPNPAAPVPDPNVHRHLHQEIHLLQIA
ncbi:hypothetical protein Fmac_009101 [Flemingia macrophylla]|uniref:PB1 domain-containing protein n=1 Tax=Flemingia macrophylla TaxID=520843 RepID=A0ABD1MZU6_9FABA